MMSLSAVSTPVELMDKTGVPKYLMTSLPPDSATVKLVVASVVAAAAVVAEVADVAVAALPLMLIPQVPLAPVPVFDGTERFDRAVAASEAPVPPLATASVPVKLMLGVAPPDEARGDEAVTEVTVPPEPVADSVPPAKLMPDPMVTLLNPPEPLPYRMAVPDVAGA